MATFYQGYRPVLQGRNYNNWIGPKGRVGVYSNYSLRDTGNELLTGFPDREYVLGTYKHATLLEYLWAGGQHVAPMKDPGLGARLSYFRYHPYENKAAGNNKVFTVGYGHTAFRTTSYSLYSNFFFDGIDSALAMINTGHARRFNRSYGGAYDPLVFKGTTAQATANPGSPLPADPFNNRYGKNQMQTWRGVPSGRAL